MKIPYDGVATVNPQGAPGVFLNSNGDAGQGLIANALKEGGQDILRTADKLQADAYKERLLNDTAEAKDLDVQYALETTDATEKYLSLTGKDAIDAKADYLKFLQEKREEIKSRASDPRVWKHADGSITNRFVRSVESASRHSAQETVRYNKMATASRASNLGDEAARARNEADFKDKLEASLGEIKQLNSDKDPETVKVLVQKQADTVVANRINGVSWQDPEAAQELLKTYGDYMSPAIRQQVTESVAKDAARVGSQKIADRVIAGDGGWDSYKKSLFGHESSNDPTAKNKKSSASGLGQIIKGTWEDIRKEHPELGLDSFEKGRFDPVQNEAASKAFTMDNVQELKDAGIKPTHKNLYMTHFMGRKGGPAFISAMENNPDTSAAGLFPEAAKSNPAVFYKTDGRARSLKEVYDLQTSNKSNKELGAETGIAKGLTPNSTNAEINDAAKRARELAQQEYPDNPDVADRAEARVRQKAASVLAEAKDRQKQNFQYITKALIGDGKNPRPTTVEELFVNKEMRDAYYNMDLDQQNRVDKALEANVARNKRQDVPLTQERIARARELRGLAATDRAAFDKIIMAGEDLPTKEINKLQELQMKPRTEKEDIELSSVLAKMERFGILKAAKLDGKNKGKEKFNQFVGRLQEELDVRAARGEVMDDKAIRALGLEMVKDHVSGPWFWQSKTPNYRREDYKPGSFGVVPGAPRAETLVPPRVITDRIVQEFQTRYKRIPTPVEINKVYDEHKDALDQWMKANG